MNTEQLQREFSEYKQQFLLSSSGQTYEEWLEQRAIDYHFQWQVCLKALTDERNALKERYAELNRLRNLRKDDAIALEMVGVPIATIASIASALQQCSLSRTEIDAAITLIEGLVTIAQNRLPFIGLVE